MSPTWLMSGTEQMNTRRVSIHTNHIYKCVHSSPHHDCLEFLHTTIYQQPYTYYYNINTYIFAAGWQWLYADSCTYNIYLHRNKIFVSKLALRAPLCMCVWVCGWVFVWWTRAHWRNSHHHHHTNQEVAPRAQKAGLKKKKVYSRSWLCVRVLYLLLLMSPQNVYVHVDTHTHSYRNTPHSRAAWIGIIIKSKWLQRQTAELSHSLCWLDAAGRGWAQRNCGVVCGRLTQQLTGQLFFYCMLRRPHRIHEVYPKHRCPMAGALRSILFNFVSTQLTMEDLHCIRLGCRNVCNFQMG